MDSSDMDTGYPKSAQAILLPIFASFAVVLLIVPFFLHYRLRNIGACSLIVFITLSNFFTFINAIIWPTEDFASWWNGAGLCDIEAKLKAACITGIATATLCIFRNLANLLDVDRAEITPTRASMRRKRIIDYSICLTVPFLQIALHYIIQYNRYYIIAISGCAPSYDNSWPTIAIMYVWPLIFCIINCYYAVAAIVRLRKHRANFSTILSSSSSNLTPSRFLRLFIMSFTLLLLYTPVSTYFFYVNLDIEWLSYDWGIVHDPSTWSIIIPLPTQGVRTFDAWVPIAMSLFVFFFFGIGGEAVETYRHGLVKIGLGRVFPSLKLPRRPRMPSDTKSWTSQFSLVSRARHYFDSARKTSNATTSGTTIVTEQSSSIRKPSLIPTDQPSEPKTTPVSALIPLPHSLQPASRSPPLNTDIDINLEPQRNRADFQTYIWSDGIGDELDISAHMLGSGVPVSRVANAGDKEVHVLTNVQMRDYRDDTV